MHSLGATCPDFGQGTIVLMSQYRRAPDKEYQEDDLKGPIGAAQTRYPPRPACRTVPAKPHSPAVAGQAAPSGPLDQASTHRCIGSYAPNRQHTYEAKIDCAPSWSDCSHARRTHTPRTRAVGRRAWPRDGCALGDGRGNPAPAGTLPIRPQDVPSAWRRRGVPAGVRGASGL